jgi:Spy/CpxP family protein refolding chaperone
MTFLYLIKKYWYYFAGAILFFTLVFLGNKDARLIQLILKKQAVTSKRADEQRKKITELKIQERQQKKDSLGRHQKEVKDLTEKHREISDKIDQEAINNVLNQREMTDEEIANLAKKFKNRFGI